MNELLIELQLPLEKAEVCRRALALETENDSMHRSEIRMEGFSQGLRIKVKARDLSAMRAVINTYLRWVIMCCNLMD